jgi:hypothetical protein
LAASALPVRRRRTPPKLPPGWEKLNLTKDQTTTLLEIITSYRPKFQAADKRFREVSDAEMRELVQILTAEQKDAAAKLRAEISVTKKDDAKKDSVQLPPGWHTLRLTEDQMKTLVKIRTTYKYKVAETRGRLEDLRAAERAQLVRELNDDQKAMLLKGITIERAKAKEKHK